MRADRIDRRGPHDRRARDGRAAQRSRLEHTRSWTALCLGLVVGCASPPDLTVEIDDILDAHQIAFFFVLDETDEVRAILDPIALLFGELAGTPPTLVDPPPGRLVMVVVDSSDLAPGGVPLAFDESRFASLAVQPKEESGDCQAAIFREAASRVVVPIPVSRQAWAIALGEDTAELAPVEGELAVIDGFALDVPLRELGCESDLGAQPTPFGDEATLLSGPRSTRSDPNPLEIEEKVLLWMVRLDDDTVIAGSHFVIYLFRRDQPWDAGDALRAADDCPGEEDARFEAGALVGTSSAGWALEVVGGCGPTEACATGGRQGGYAWDLHVDEDGVMTCEASLRTALPLRDVTAVAGRGVVMVGDGGTVVIETPNDVAIYRQPDSDLASSLSSIAPLDDSGRNFVLGSNDRSMWIGDPFDRDLRELRVGRDRVLNLDITDVVPLADERAFVAANVSNNGDFYVINLADDTSDRQGIFPSRGLSPCLSGATDACGLPILAQEIEGLSAIPLGDETMIVASLTSCTSAIQLRGSDFCATGFAADQSRVAQTGAYRATDRALGYLTLIGPDGRIVDLALP